MSDLTKIAEGAGHSYTRRTFLQALVAAPLVAVGMALAPEEADAASLVTLCKSLIRIKGPMLWKQKLSTSAQGHTSGVYHIEFYWPKNSYDMALVRYDGMFKKGAAKGKSKFSYQGSDEYGVNWKIRRGKATASVFARNIPYLIWQDLHGEGYHSFTKTQAVQLLKLTTGGKISYASLRTWSRSKAIKAGNKAVRAWVGSKIIKHSRLL